MPDYEWERLRRAHMGRAQKGVPRSVLIDARPPVERAGASTPAPHEDNMLFDEVDPNWLAGWMVLGSMLT